MKRLIFPLLAMVAIFMLPGCSEKFDVAAPYKNITVIYGFVDLADTAHYIRIQKAFLDQNKSAVTMAQASDSSFYKTISVRIGRFSISGTNSLHDTIHLNRVDLTAEGYPKQAGAFFNAPNYAYKFTDAIDPKYVYRIYVTNFVTGQVDSADAPVIDDKNINTFNISMIDDSELNRQGLSFFSITGHKYIDLSGNYFSPSNFNFNGLTSPVGVSQAFVRFNWLDSDIVTHQATHKYSDFDGGILPTQKGGFEYKIENFALYNALKQGMGDATSLTQVRLLDRCDILVYLSTPDFYQYQQIGLTQGTGLTGSEIEPIYTNVKGANVLGLYTSRGLRQGRITIEPRTVDSLIASPLLSSCRIIGTVY